MAACENGSVVNEQCVTRSSPFFFSGENDDQQETPLL